MNHYINVVSYIPLRGKSYIPLPKELRNSKKGLINLKNEDNKCFLWCHIRHKNPVKIHPERVKMSDKEFVQKLDYSGITFPVQIKDVGKIEKQNSINISIFGYENEKLYPIRLSEKKCNDHMDLLFITEGENEKTKSHFVFIQNFDRLMYNFTEHKDTKDFCKRCLHCFSSKNLLERHKGDCFLINFFFFHEHLFIYFSSLRYSIYITILTLLTIRVTYTENTITQLNVIQTI